MKIYLASVAPNNETHRPLGMLNIPRRLLSYYGIAHGGFVEENDVFINIKRLKEGSRNHDDNED
jgi:hypothetical protein